jgi:hypothetical protein
MDNPPQNRARVRGRLVYGEDQVGDDWLNSRLPHPAVMGETA